MSYADDVIAKLADLFAQYDVKEIGMAALFLNNREIESIRGENGFNTNVQGPPLMGQPLRGVLWSVPVYEAGRLISGQAIVLPMIEHLDAVDLGLNSMPVDQQFDIEF